MSLNRISILIFFVLINIASAFTGSRTWSLRTGDEFFAEFVDCDISKNLVKLKVGDNVSEYSLNEFSTEDNSWLIEYGEFKPVLNDKMKGCKGNFHYYQFKGKETANVYFYLPSAYLKEKKLPILFLFHSSGHALRYVSEFVKVAEELGVIVISCDVFKNTGAVWNEKDDKMLECFNKMLPELEDLIRHDSSKIFMGGSYGGAQRAYHFSFKVKRKWAGIFANNGWLGSGDFLRKPYCENMKVAMLNGKHEANYNSWLRADCHALEQRKCETKVIMYSKSTFEEKRKELLKWLLVDSH